MTEITPLQEALYVLQSNVPRSELSMAAQLEYDQIRPAWERGEARPAAEDCRRPALPGKPSIRPRLPTGQTRRL